MKPGAFGDIARARIMARSGGLCEICSVRDASQLHHRRPRGSGGSKRPETGMAGNALALCAPCHMQVESDRQFARNRGWLVSQFVDYPADVSVWRHGQWVLLDDEGGIAPAEVEP